MALDGLTAASATAEVALSSATAPATGEGLVPNELERRAREVGFQTLFAVLHLAYVALSIGASLYHWRRAYQAAHGKFRPGV